MYLQELAHVSSCDSWLFVCLGGSIPSFHVK